MKSEQTSRHAARSGFETLDPAQLGGLSDAQRDAIARAVVAQGPTLIRKGTTQRLLSKVAFGSALAAAAAFAFMLQSNQTDPDKKLPAIAAAPSCAADTGITPITSEEEGRSRIQIGSRVRAVTAEATRFSIVEAAPCVTRLALNEGTLTLQARELGGGTLLVDTPHGQVRAEGAFLRIVTLASSTSIRVVEGAVVMRGIQGAESIRAGRAVTVGPQGTERFALSGEDRTSVLGAFDAPASSVEVLAQDAGAKSSAAARPTRTTRARAAAPEVEPAVSTTALLAEADSLWRKGSHDAARQAFRRASEDKGPMGEAALVRLARLELSAGSSERALSALSARKSRVAAGTLGAEALWLEAEAFDRAGRSADAVRAAERLIRDYPSAPQVPSARRLLTKSKVP